MEDKEKNVVKNSKPVKLKAKGRSVTGMPLDDININPQLDTKNKQQVQEQSRGGVVLTFGRMNPPTVGHERLVKKVVAVAAQARATPMVFLSHSQDKKKNPLDYQDKVRFARAAFGNVVQASPAKTLIDILKTLQTKFQELTLVVGSDRVGEFETLLNKYNGKDFTFAKINVVSAGERDPDAEGVEGMSASKMRAAVQTGDQQKFISGLPQSLKSQGRAVFKLVSAGMQLHEELEAEDLLSEVLTVDQRRKRGMIMRRYSAKIGRARELAKKRLAPTEKLKKRSLIQARDIIRRRVAGRRGANYDSLSPSEKIQIDIQVQKRKGVIKKIAGRLMPKVKAAEYARLKSFLHGSPMQHMHSGPDVQHEQFNQMFEEFANTVEIVTVDDILREMTDLVLEKIITEKQIQALEKRAQRSGIQFDLLEQVYVRGLLDTMGDQHAAFNRVNAFCCGGKSAMNEDNDLYLQIERKDLNDVFESDNKPYVKPHIEKGSTQQSGWKASNKHGKVKYFGKDFKAAADKHAGDINEDLRKWFSQKWVRMNTKGEIKGDCAREEGEGKPKCLPQAKAQAMSKEDRAKAARRKRREDPVADRQGKGGKPVNVATEAYITEKNSPTNPALWSRAKALARSKFDVYPSAYANGWAAKWYKSKGGSWKSVSENVAFENFLDGKGPGKRGDSARHGLKGKSTAELKSIRSSDTASPRKKQLAHFMLNMTRKESIEEGYDINSKHYKALTDLDLNTKNRDMTTKHDGYGPLNPGDEKGSESFWDDKAKMWNTTMEAAMEARCGNCAAFNQAPAIMKKMAEGLGPAGEKIQELSNLGFCELFEFKCAGDRSCNKWLVGGPITEDIDPTLKEMATGSKLRMRIDAAPRTKLDRKKIAYVSRPDDTRDQGEMNQHRQALSKLVGEEGNSQPNASKRLMGTKLLIKAYKKDTPGQDINDAFSEAVKAADKEPVVIPSHYSASGKVIPAKTTMRRSSKVIVNKGDNTGDGR